MWHKAREIYRGVFILCCCFLSCPSRLQSGVRNCGFKILIVASISDNPAGRLVDITVFWEQVQIIWVVNINFTEYCILNVQRILLRDVHTLHWQLYRHLKFRINFWTHKDFQRRSINCTSYFFYSWLIRFEEARIISQGKQNNFWQTEQFVNLHRRHRSQFRDKE
jgi:hypothetical protein